MAVTSRDQERTVYYNCVKLSPNPGFENLACVSSAQHRIPDTHVDPGGGGGGGGALSQVSYGGVQLRGPNPYPILGKTGLRKHTLF